MTMNSQSGQRMLDYLPPYYQNSRIMHSILDSQGLEADKLRQAFDGALDQVYVSTATWGLDTWEYELALDKTEDLPAERRNRIISRLRGTGTATTQVVKNVVESYEKGTVEVIEDHNGYTIYIKFVNTGGIPPNLTALKSALRAVVPAHLEIGYKFKYLLWGELDSLQLTWEEIDNMNMTWAQWEVFVCLQWDELETLNLSWDQVDAMSMTWNEWEVYM